MEYMIYDFGAATYEEAYVSLNGQVTSRKDTFSHIESILHRDMDIDKDISNTIKAWRIK